MTTKKTTSKPAETATAKAPRKQTILSGMQPTGSLHIGNLEGALVNWVNLQDEYWMFCCIVDWHALTAEWQDTKALKENVFQMAVNFMAAGLDPEKCAIFVQSEVKEHAELHLLFSMMITVPTLTRLPTFQEKKESLDSYGFLGYPVLQAADICLYNADKVPVGKDQEKHIWLANDLAKRFNNTYKKVFNLPEALFTPTPLVPGSDRRKMSKSIGNHIPLEVNDRQTEKIIRGYITDEEKVRKGDPGRPEICPIYTLHTIYTKDANNAIAPACRTGELGCVECKIKLSTNLNARLHPIREKRNELLGRPDHIWDVLQTGADRARNRAQNVMEKVRSAMKTDYRGKKKK